MDYGGDNLIKSNKDLIDAINEIIKESGYKKVFIADQLGITRQAFTQLLQKQNFSIDDANRILNIIGYETVTDVKKK